MSDPVLPGEGPTNNITDDVDTLRRVATAAVAAARRGERPGPAGPDPDEEVSSPGWSVHDFELADDAYRRWE